MIEICLQEKQYGTVNDIYKWIRDKNPCAPNDKVTTKAAIRRCLLKHYSFKKRTPKIGVTNVWYVQHELQKDTIEENLPSAIHNRTDLNNFLELQTTSNFSTSSSDVNKIFTEVPLQNYDEYHLTKLEVESQHSFGFISNILSLDMDIDITDGCRSLTSGFPNNFCSLSYQNDTQKRLC